MNLLFWFVSSHALIVVAWFMCKCLGFRSNHSEKLRLHYGVLILFFSILLVQLFIPVQTSFRPVQKFLDISSIKVSEVSENQISVLPKVAVSSGVRTLHLSVPSDSNFILFLIFLCLVTSFKITRDLRLLAQIKRDSFRIKKIGKIEILAHDRITVPLTFWTLNHATVVIPNSILMDTESYRISVLHEIQHQRQRDPMWMFALEAFIVFGFLNPFAKLWVRRITELQEFACDETLIGRNKVNSGQYARCLLQVAESTLQPEFAPACATGLLFRMERHQLKRRIKMLLSINHQMRSRSKLWPKLLIFTLFLGGAAYTTKSIAQAQADRKVTLEDANAMAKKLSGAEGIPVAINDAVLKELNRYLDTPLSRQSFKEALGRMKKDYQPVVDSVLAQYQLPKALDAIPLIESRYQNLSEGGEMHSAGIWQFIPPTARRMGIPVHKGRDDRLNVEKLTDAAGRLLKADALFYNNLGLSILAFNWGEQKVNHMLGQTLSRDPWVLVHANGDDTYLPKVIAGMLIVANPESVE